MAVKQLKIEGNVEAVSVGASNCDVFQYLIFVSCPDPDFVNIPVKRSVNTLILSIVPLLSHLPQVHEAVEDIAVVDRHDLIARDLNRVFLCDHSANILYQGAFGICGIKRDDESESRSPRDDDIMSTKVWESNQQDLVLVYCARIVSHHD